MYLMSTYLFVAVILHQLPDLELNKVHEDGFGEVFKDICCCQIWDQTPLLQSK